MGIASPQFSTEPPSSWHKQAEENNPDTLKATLKDGNSSASQFSHALSRLQELYGLKELKGTATDEEKETYKLLKKLVTGQISAADTEKLGTMLGVN